MNPSQKNKKVKTVSYWLFLAGIVSLFLVGCFFPNNRIDRLWFYTYTSSSADGDSVLTPASFINLQKDGSYTRDFGGFDYGKWIIKDKKLLLTNYKNENFTFSVSYFAGNEMQLGFNNKTPDHFESQPGSFASAKQNPFSKENNLWRIPATKKETDDEIRDRLLDHFIFWETYFTWALDNELQSVDVRSTPTLIKIYGNGFALKPFQELPRAWVSLFYDKEDCQKANDKIKYLFEHNDIAWPHTESKYKMFISAFQQLEKKLR
jgi:hypothetical protein